MNWLKQSTAVTLKLGPFLDSTDGDTEETGLTIAYTDVMISKNGGTIAAKSDTTGATHDAKGFYGVPLNTTDTGTLGRLKVYIHVAGALAVWEEYLIVPANVYDSLVLGTDYLQGDTIQIEGLDATDQINAACDTALTDYDAATGAELAAVDAKIDIIDTNVDAVLVDTNELQTNQGNWLTATGFATEAKQDIIDTNVDSILVDTGTTIPASISALNDFDPAVDVVARVTLVDTTTTNTDMRGTNSAATEAKQDIIDANVDAILTDTGATIPAQISGLNDLSVSDILAGTLTDLSDTEIDSGETITVSKALRSMFNRFFRKVTQTADTQTVFNDSNSAIADMTTSDDGTTQTKGST